MKKHFWIILGSLILHTDNRHFWCLVNQRSQQIDHCSRHRVQSTGTREIEEIWHLKIPPEEGSEVGIPSSCYCARHGLQTFEAFSGGPRYRCVHGARASLIM